jgi:hypothetical protein
MKAVIGFILGWLIRHFADHHQPQPPGPVIPAHPNCRCSTTPTRRTEPKVHIPSTLVHGPQYR